MKFILDAHLPRSLCGVLARRGHDAVHTLDLPAGNASKDSVINHVSLAEERVVISKDIDFFYSHQLQGRPWRLLLVKTGNISTRDLRELIERNLPAIETALQLYTLVEIDRSIVNPVV